VGSTGKHNLQVWDSYSVTEICEFSLRSQEFGKVICSSALGEEPVCMLGTSSGFVVKMDIREPTGFIAAHKISSGYIECVKYLENSHLVVSVSDETRLWDDRMMNRPVVEFTDHFWWQYKPVFESDYLKRQRKLNGYSAMGPKFPSIKRQITAAQTSRGFDATVVPLQKSKIAVFKPFQGIKDFDISTGYLTDEWNFKSERISCCSSSATLTPKIVPRNSGLLLGEQGTARLYDLKTKKVAYNLSPEAAHIGNVAITEFLGNWGLLTVGLDLNLVVSNL
jgi:WD40 repeat protein